MDTAEKMKHSVSLVLRSGLFVLIGITGFLAPLHQGVPVAVAAFDAAGESDKLPWP